MICRLCPRNCGAERTEETAGGFCSQPLLPVLARAGLHLWEEPCLTGKRGAGAVFFSGCTLRCGFCQNHEISTLGAGKPVSVSRLREIFRALEAEGASCLDLVTGTQFTDAILEALESAPGIPVVWNTGGYERIETLRRLEGHVQVYLPDLKYADADLALRCSRAADYPEVARAAILEMVRQTGPYELDGEGLLRRGVLIRHLMLPGQLPDTKRVIDFVASFPPGTVLFSLMRQFTPLANAEALGLGRRITAGEYRAACGYMAACGITDGYTQGTGAADEAFVPAFDFTGI
ncbi:MAG TPA: radical SAM protein [Oscillospiraceae bacterium]|nr:radical SAM protein [Oscillospiraceae bacterium]